MVQWYFPLKYSLHEPSIHNEGITDMFSGSYAILSRGLIYKHIVIVMIIVKGMPQFGASILSRQ